MGKFQSLIITICLAFKIITTHGLELCQSQIGYEYFIQGIMENTLPNTELGHVDIGGDITQIEIVQKAHAFFSFNNITRNVTLIKELDTDQDAEDIKPLILTCRKVQEASSLEITVNVLVTDWNEIHRRSILRTILYRFQRTVDKVDICKSEDFSNSNNTFKSVTKELKRQGKAAVDHHPPITDEDLEKVYDFVMSRADAKHLQYKVFLDIMLHFGRRGRENLASLTRKDFAVTTDQDGRLYVYMTRDFATKNHQDDSEKSSDGTMYQIKDSDRCPVKSFTKYMRGLNPLCQSFFQVPRTEPIEGIYYNNLKLGHNRLGVFMRDISKEAGLSQVYTNHSYRATTVRVLDEAQVPSRLIMTVTGHKSETSLKTYTGRTGKSTMRAMSEKISEKTGGKPTSASSSYQFNVDDIQFDQLEPLTNSKSDILMIEIDEFFHDTENVDNLLLQAGCAESSVSKTNNVVSTSQHVVNFQRRPMFPMPVFNNCSNITINYNCSS